ncbi:hypothetical protein SH661x_003588 [Planctomicrobium sp. SH661]|uniref:hypothetical protein n=1 Tax=Planctomicrobium sp. SH661 TaxID=3448124 RepID=UPI003F5BD3A9
MNNPIPALVFGVLLLLVGAAMLRSQRRGRRDADNALTGEERKFLSLRVRRRNQVAGMIILIGIMIPVGDSLIPWKNAPGTFAVYWMIVIGLALWTGLLAVGDMAATRAHMARELNRLHRSQLELHRVAQRARKMNQDGSGEM